jgi:hypothetical protein
VRRFLRSTAIVIALGFVPLPPIDVHVYASPATLVGGAAAIPDWIKGYCCGPQDMHRLRGDQVHQDDAGLWHIDGYPGPVPRENVNRDNQASQDASYYAFYCEPDTKGAACTAGKFSQVWCFFTPMAF